MNKPFKIFFIIFAAVFVLSAAQTANACSCGGSPTVDIEFGNSENVAILKVQSLEYYPAGEKGVDGSPIKYAKLTVEKVFKGNFKVGQELTFSQGICCVCSWTFDEEDIGKSYLFYLSKENQKNKIWSTSICSRSGSLKKVAEDLLYLEKLDKVRGKTRLSGQLQKIMETPESDDRYSFSVLPNHKIRIVGKNKNIELVTDENGVYEIYGLLPGKYKIFPEKIDGFKFSIDDNPFEEVEIKAQSHTEEHFYFEINNAVSGKVFDQQGAPLDIVCLSLIPVNNEKAKNYSKGDCTDKNGFFEIRAIPAGDYVLVFNRDGKPTLNEPFGTFYYPNVKTVEEATVISVNADYFLRDLKIVPPEIVEKRTLSGTLLFSDGQPVANETVSLIKFEDIMRSSNGSLIAAFQVKTDRNGKFSIVTLKGQQGVLIGSFYSFVGEYLNCPEIDNLIKEKGGSAQRLDTAGKTIYETGNLSSIELRFPFPGCKKAKID